MNDVMLYLISIIALIIVPLILHILKTINDKKKREFDTYHKLISELLVTQIKYGDEIEKVPERQAAIVFELRRYKKYSAITTLKTKWIANQQGGN